MQIVADCDSSGGDGGASTIALTFLILFAALLVFDAILTVLALRQTVLKDSERVRRLEERVKQLDGPRPTQRL